jgi:hypothetical protein
VPVIKRAHCSAEGLTVVSAMPSGAAKRFPDYALPSVTKRLIAEREFCVVS